MPGPIFYWRFDLEIISTAIFLPSADSRRVEHKNKQTKACFNSLSPENADGSLVSYFRINFGSWLGLSS